MKRSFLTPRRLLALLAVLLLVSSFLPVDQDSQAAEQRRAWGSRLAERPRALVAAAISPVTRLLHALSTGLRSQDRDPVLWDTWDDLAVRYGRALQRNERLEQENTALKRQIAQLSQIRELFGLAGVSLVDARVNASSTDPLNPVLTINRGERHGVRRQMAVASAFSLVGEVTNVGPFTSDVRLITAPGTQLRVRLVPPTPDAAARTIEVQLERAEDGPWFEVQLGTQQPVQPGDLAHLSDPIWPTEAMGFVVGQVIEVGPDPDDPLNFQRVIVKPIPPLTRLNRVTVLVPTD